MSDENKDDGDRFSRPQEVQESLGIEYNTVEETFSATYRIDGLHCPWCAQDALNEVIRALNKMPRRVTSIAEVSDQAIEQMVKEASEDDSIPDKSRRH